MKVSLIVAMSENAVIGKDNKLLWHIPEDLKHFKKLTLNKAIIMGRKTFQSIGRPLPKRLNIVLTKDLTFTQEGIQIVHSLSEALKVATSYNNEEIMVIGGEAIYQAFLPMADTIYRTLVHEYFEGDVRFPALNLEEWDIKELESHVKYSFQQLSRKEKLDAVNY
ncbi:MAG: dfrA [Francisellaceae bacterium]|nr:dfrA [Francisellaceae bacterium]